MKALTSNKFGRYLLARVKESRIRSHHRPKFLHFREIFVLNWHKDVLILDLLNWFNIYVYVHISALYNGIFYCIQSNKKYTDNIWTSVSIRQITSRHEFYNYWKAPYKSVIKWILWINLFDNLLNHLKSLIFHERRNTSLFVVVVFINPHHTKNIIS